MNSKTLSIGKQIDLLYLYIGITWLLIGSFGLFDGIIFNLLKIFALLGCIVFLIILSRSKKEMDDEMSIRNLEKAKAKAQTNMRIITCCLICIIRIIDFIPAIPKISVDLQTVIVPIFFIYLGIEGIIIGLLFRRNERNEDECTF